MPLGLVFGRGRKASKHEPAAFGIAAEHARRAGKPGRAEALCREGLKSYPDHLSARVTLGWALLDQERRKEARVEFETVLKRAPDNFAAIRGLAEMHDDGDEHGRADWHDAHEDAAPTGEPPRMWSPQGGAGAASRRSAQADDFDPDVTPPKR